MRRILLDEGVPIGVRTVVTGFHVEAVAEIGWAGLTNGDLIRAAEEAGFEVLITCDQKYPLSAKPGGPAAGARRADHEPLGHDPGERRRSIARSCAGDGRHLRNGRDAEAATPPAAPATSRRTRIKFKVPRAMSSTARA
jgi:hypothetical protein